MCDYLHFLLFFFFNDTATTEIYTLSLHDALPIYSIPRVYSSLCASVAPKTCRATVGTKKSHMQNSPRDRKSTRLNSSHANISYAVFCLKKKKKKTIIQNTNRYNNIN